MTKTFFHTCSNIDIISVMFCVRAGQCHCRASEAAVREAVGSSCQLTVTAD